MTNGVLESIAARIGNSFLGSLVSRLFRSGEEGSEIAD